MTKFNVVEEQEINAARILHHLKEMEMPEVKAMSALATAIGIMIAQHSRSANACLEGLHLTDTLATATAAYHFMKKRPDLKWL